MKYFLFAFLSLILLFFFTRLFSITDSLFYLNDMGRDSLVLLDWKQSGKPPLLGPQTSALPFNQSAFYFYLLYPAFLLTNGSPYSALYTLDIYFVIVFSITFYMIYRSKQQNIMISFLLTMLLMILHPQFIIQNRFVWNPSFVAPLILFSFFDFYFLTQHFTVKKILALGLTLALATSLSYSVIPVVIGICCVSSLFFRKKLIWLILSLIGWITFFNVPTLLFELRHHFLLTQMMLHQSKVSQINTDISSKIENILSYVFTAPTVVMEKWLFFLFLISFIIAARWYWKNKSITIEQSQNAMLFLASSNILIIALLLTFILPVPLLAHYIFAIVVIGMIVVTALPKIVRNGVILALVCVWASSLLRQDYFKPAVRTVSQMESCYTHFCEQEKEPLFVSMQSSLLPFHNGPEHRYLLRKAGCNVQNIESGTAAANTMAIVVESSEFTFGKTSYNELTEFNPQEMGKTYSCQDNLQIITVTR